MFNNSLIHNSHRNHTNRIFYENIFRSIIWSLHPTGRIVQINLHLRRFLSVSDTGCSGNKITVTSTLKFWNIYLVVGLIFRVLGVVQVAFDHHLIYHVHFTKQRVILFLFFFYSNPLYFLFLSCCTSPSDGMVCESLLCYFILFSQLDGHHLN